MGRHIIKQPNGKLAIWSTIVDNFIMTDVTKEEYIAFRIQEETERVEKDINDIVDRLDTGQRQSYTAHNWEEALRQLEYIHGREELDKLLRGLNNDMS